MAMKTIVFIEFLTCNVTKMWFQLKMHQFLYKCPTAEILNVKKYTAIDRTFRRRSLHLRFRVFIQTILQPPT